MDSLASILKTWESARFGTGPIFAASRTASCNIYKKKRLREAFENPLSPVGSHVLPQADKELQKQKAKSSDKQLVPAILDKREFKRRTRAGDKVSITSCSNVSLSSDKHPEAERIRNGARRAKQSIKSAMPNIHTTYGRYAVRR